MPPQTYRDQFYKLLDKGYLVLKKGNKYDFFEIPKNEKCSENSTNFATSGVLLETSDVHSTTESVEAETGNNREIYNINNTKNSIDNWQKKQAFSATTKDEFKF